MLFGTDRGATGPGQEPGPSLQGGRRLRTELRDECLKLEIFYSLKEAQVVIGAWEDYDTSIRLGTHRGAAVVGEAGGRRGHGRAFAQPRNIPDEKTCGITGFSVCSGTKETAP